MKKEDKKVSVEMTEEQKEKVVEILAAEPPKEKERAEVSLRYAHWINGTQYGPGTIQCDADIASALYSQDYNKYLSMLSQQDSKLTQIAMSPSGIRTIKISVEKAYGGGVKKL